MRPFLVIAGLVVLFVATLLLIAQPPLVSSFTLPPVAVSHNVPYFLFVRSVQWLWGYSGVSVMIANSLLMIGVALLVFRLGWTYADPKYRLEGGATAMLLFEVSSLAVVLPLTLGFQGGYLVAPLLLLLFLNVMQMVDHWSVFMRAIVLSLVWSFMPWVHLPTAIFILLAWVPWILYNRRPMAALGILLTIFLLGTLLFSMFWTLGCALARQWSLLQGPVDTLRTLGIYVQQEIRTPVGGDLSTFIQRLEHLLAWCSPFVFILGLWAALQNLVVMIRERRTGAIDMAGLLSLLLLGVIVATPDKDVLPGAWYALMLLSLWTPLLARQLAKRENFYSRGFRFTFLTGLVVGLAGYGFLPRGVARGALVPDGIFLAKLIGVVLLGGGLTYPILKKHSLPTENRVQALLAGAALAYFVVMDVSLLG